MAWIESHEDVGDHHKTQYLAEQLQCSIPTAVGTLHLLWHYTLKVAWRDGNLEKMSKDSISRACWWNGDSELLIRSFQKSGYLDGMKVHDWPIYASQIIYQRKYNENRRKSRADFPKSKPDSPMSSNITAVRTPATLPYLTIKTYVEYFDEIWRRYPKRDGKKAATKYFKASIKTEQDWFDINAALDNYLKSETVLKGFIKNGSTWFNNWRDWIEVQAENTFQDRSLQDIQEKLRLKENKNGH